MAYPIPPPTPVPWRPLFHSYSALAHAVRGPSLTCRHALGADISLAIAPPFLSAGMALDITRPLGIFVAMLGPGAAVMAGVFRHTSSRVVLSPRGTVSYQPTVRTFPWAQVHAIELTEVAGVRRAGVLTVDGGRVLLPAPRGKRLIGRNGRFLVELAETQRWHQHDAPR